jgi:NitT/TauT family transport system ATP-binding protein
MSLTIVRPEKLEVEGLVKRFAGGRRRPAVTALDGIDLSVSAGELVCIVGASGCGKSTLLNVVGGLETADAGRVEIDGETVVGPGADRGMVFQGYSLFPWKSVAANIAFGLETARVPRAERRDRVDELLGIMGLTPWAHMVPRELSGGMRVWRDLGTTILMVTHDTEEAVYLSGRVYVLTSHPGRVAAEVPIPLPADRGPSIKRDALFLDLRDQVQEILVDQVRA